MSEITTCPGCGHPVKIYSTGEGTNSYQPVCPSLEALRARDARIAIFESEQPKVDKAFKQMAAMEEAIRIMREAIEKFSELEPICAEALSKSDEILRGEK